MFLGFIDSHSIFIVLHLLGVVLGAGGAFMSDFMFFSSVKDEKISSTEFRFLRLGSKMVWVGIAILVISGVFLFLDHPDRYLHSSKFIAKMTIVAILIVNGAIFHFVNIPRLHRHEGMHFPSSDEFIRKLPLLIMAGTISMVSWVSALVLGALRSIPYSYTTIIGVYFIILAFAVIFGILFKKHFLLTQHRKK